MFEVSRLVLCSSSNVNKRGAPCIYYETALTSASLLIFIAAAATRSALHFLYFFFAFLVSCSCFLR